METIIEAAIKDGFAIFHLPPPNRHSDVFELLRKQNPHIPPGAIGKPDDQGFLTSKGRFVDRKEAAQIALAASQISALKFHSEELFSEDLW